MHSYDDHWLHDPSRDRPLNHQWRIADTELVEKLHLPKLKTKAADDVLHLIAADILMSARMYSGRRISYSRSAGHYKRRRQYSPRGYTLATVTAAIDLLEQLGYIVDHDRRPPGRRGTQSSFRPNPLLAELRVDAVLEPVRCEIIMKDEDGDVIPYAESGRVHDMRAVVRRVNQVLAETGIVLDAEGIVAEGVTLRKGDYVMYPALKSLYRVFNGKWTLGGRYYGGWWQAVKSEDRKHLRLDGERTVEIDYSQIHPRIIYQEAGIELVGDAYDIPGWKGTKELRDLCKAAFNILVNATCYKSALGALAWEMGGDRQGAEELIDAIKERHRDVAECFHSGVGLRLQGLDARIAEIVLTEMTVKRGIPVLPIHDSFVVAESHRTMLVRVMQKAFERVVGKTSDPEQIVKANVRNTEVVTETCGHTDYKWNSSSPATAPTSPVALPSIVDSGSSPSVPFAISVAASSRPAGDLGTPQVIEPLKPVVRRPAPAFLRHGNSTPVDWEVRSATRDAERSARNRQASPPST